MAFFVYDLTFLVLFTLFIILFLYKTRKKLNRELGIAFLYKTQAGVIFINYVGTHYKRFLKSLKYVIIVVGYFLMIGILFLIGRSVYIYVRFPTLVTDIIKAPPIAPVIPYFPTLFGLDSFFPPFYFTYFIVALAIVAIAHEFFHGIYMKIYNIRIKSTGFLFLGPLLGAFVEQDDRDMLKAKKTDQMAILGAGVFANFILAVLFFFIWMGAFYGTFIPMGAVFDSYAMTGVEIGSIQTIGGMIITNPSNQEILKVINENNITGELILGTDGDALEFVKITADGKDYFMTVDVLKEQLKLGTEYLLLYADLPAINVALRGTIISIDDNVIDTHKQLKQTLEQYNPGDEILIKTRYEGEILEFDIVLTEHIVDPEKPMIGIGNQKSNSIRTNVVESLAVFKDPYTEYKIKSEFLLFIYYLVFWIFLLNLLVAFFNMLPFTIFDGGRFFYLTIWGITRSENAAKRVYKWINILIVAALLVMMMSWLFGITR